MTDTKKAVTIITVVLNSELLLEETIKSVISQADSDFEYIIIDGVSIDGTLDIINRYKSKIAYWVSEPDKGIYDAMNKGVLKAHGRWIYFLNSGDTFINSNVLSHLFSKNIDSNTQILYGNTKVKGSNKVIKPCKNINKNYFFSRSICHQSIFCRRDMFDKIGCYNLNYKVMADQEWLLRATIANARVTYIDLDVCVWDPIGYCSQNKDIVSQDLSEMRRTYFNNFEIVLLHLTYWILRIRNKILDFIFTCGIPKGTRCLF